MEDKMQKPQLFLINSRDDFESPNKQMYKNHR